MSKDKEMQIVEYAENLFAYLQELGWDPDGKRIKELEARLLAVSEVEKFYVYTPLGGYQQVVDAQELAAALGKANHQKTE